MSAKPDIRVWVLAGRRVGDATQAIALAERLGWPFAIKTLDFSGPRRGGPNHWQGRTLRGLSKEARDALTPPWPDLLISVGRRSVPVARWIAQHNPEAKLVHLGRPRLPLRYFDLVIATPQYAMRDAPNLLRIPSPIHRIDAARLDAGSRKLAPLVAHLPRPYLTVLVGGRAGPYRFDPEVAQELARACLAEVAREQGSLLVTTSPRTGAEASAALAEALQGAPHYLHLWRENPPDNPYFGLLGLADRIVVTSESVSMMAEATATGKPVQLYELPCEPDVRLRRIRRLHANALLRPAVERLDDWGWLALPRRTEAVTQQLIERGAAAPFGSPAGTETGRVEDALPAVLERVRAIALAPEVSQRSR